MHGTAVNIHFICPVIYNLFRFFKKLFIKHFAVPCTLLPCAGVFLLAPGEDRTVVGK
jgi:hypothetical protein